MYLCHLKGDISYLSQPVERTNQCFIGTDITDCQVIEDQADQRERESDLYTQYGTAQLIFQYPCKKANKP